MIKKTNLSMCVVMLVFLLGMTCMAAGQIIYVDYNAPGPIHDGTSWPTAYKYLQDALAVALPGHEIWVAACTYRPDEDTVHPNGTGDRTATFGLKNDVAIYGGFPSGGDPNWFDRDPNKYVTILSGDLAGNDIDVPNPWDLLNEPTRDENSYHVVTAINTSPSAVFDGFTITAGNTNIAPDANGAGMYNIGGDPTLRECTFSRNSSSQIGGGLYNEDGNPMIMHCMFSENMANWDGGGMQNDSNSDPNLVDCVFSNNYAQWDGGGMYSHRTSCPKLINCVFNGNIAGYGGGFSHDEGGSSLLTNCQFIGNIAEEGGGMQTDELSAPILANCTFTDNWANSDGGAMYNESSTPTLTNCIFTTNSAEDCGGGMYNTGEDANCIVILTNCLFCDNSAANHGGGLLNHGSEITMTNCTFAFNLANDGRAVACGYRYEVSPSDIQLTNCILWDGGDEMSSNDGSSITITYSNIQDGWPGEGNINKDPCFAELGYWDPNGTPQDANDDFWVDGGYHLLPGSPCIDAGDGNVAPVTDILGNPRHDDLGIKNTGTGDPNYADIGAYEFQGTSPIRLSYIEISGLTEVNENSGAQYTCTAYYSDGNTSDVTSSSIWDENSPYAAISGTGYLTTLAVPSDQPCRITASFEGKSANYDITIKDTLPTLINKCLVKAGKTDNSDMILILGQMDANEFDFHDANEIQVTIDSNDMVNPCIKTFPINGKTYKNGRYSYSGTEDGVRKSFTYNLKTGKFSFTAKNVDLSGLGCPLTIEIKIGDYIGAAEVSEAIVNGPKKPIPIKLMMGVKNALRVDKYKVKRGKKPNTDQLTVKGGFSVADTNVNLANVDFVVGLAGQTWTIPTGSFTAKNGVFTCKNIELSGIANARLNLNTCSFTLTIKSTTITAGSGAANFSVQFADFSESVQIVLP